MERCANCTHLVESHDLNGCFAGDEKDEAYQCPCLFDYDGKGTFNSKQLPVAARPAPSLRNDAGQCRGCLAPEGAECTRDCLLRLAYGRGRAAGQDVRPSFEEHRAKTVAPARNDQVGGDHYRTLKIQPWDIVDEYALDHYRATAIKYVLRADRKGKKLEDLRKAVHCLRKAIEIEEGKHV